MKEYPTRKRTRLKDFDYSQEGYYFITICTKDRECILSQIIEKSEWEVESVLSDYGKITDSYLRRIHGIEKYVIMPNHIHMIIHKTNGKSIAFDIRSLKGITTKQIGFSIWQKNYYDHVIRDEADFLIKWQYIDENPARWRQDEYAPGSPC